MNGEIAISVALLLGRHLYSLMLCSPLFAVYWLLRCIVLSMRGILGPLYILCRAWSLQGTTKDCLLQTWTRGL